MKRMILQPCKAREALSFAEICIAILIFALVLIPIMQLFLHSSSIVKISKHELHILNIGNSFIAQAGQFQPKQLLDIDEMIVQPDADGKFELPARFASIDSKITLPASYPTGMKITYNATPFSPGNIYGPPDAEAPKLLTLSCSWADSMGGPKIATFPVIIFQASRGVR